jgi:septation ring formation regulator EzrA
MQETYECAALPGKFSDHKFDNLQSLADVTIEVYTDCRALFLRITGLTEEESEKYSEVQSFLISLDLRIKQVVDSHYDFLDNYRRLRNRVYVK